MKKLVILFVSISIFLASGRARADTFEVAYNTAQWLPVVLIDSADGVSGKTGVVYSGVTVYYKEGIGGTWTQHTLSATSCTASNGNWCEDSSTNAPGVYKFYVPTTVVDTKGKLFYIVKGSGIKNYYGWVSVKTTTSDTESDSIASILDDTGTSGVALSAAAVDAVWDEAKSGHTTAGTFGYYLDAQVSASGDPWSTALPGAYGAGTAGKIIGDNINATVSSRSSHSAADVWMAGTRTITGGTVTTNNDKTGYSLTQAFPANFANLAVTATTGQVTVGTNNDKTGYALSAAGVDAVLDEPVEGSYTMRQVLCALAAAQLGKSSGMGTATVTFRNLGDTLNRISGTMDANYNRTAVTLTLTGCP